MSQPASVLKGATIAFDLDGTLVDTAPDLIGALNLVLAERGLPPVSVEAARVLVGRGARALISRGFTLAGEPIEDAELDTLTTRFIQLYRERIADESRPFPGLTEALERLTADGAVLCVCTNKRTDLSIALLEALGLSSHFVSITGADLTPAAKPDPRCFLAAIHAAGGDPSFALMVGDSDNDVLAAQAARAPVIAVSFGFTETPARELGADMVIDHFEELYDVAVRLLAKRAKNAA
ncbi:HAD-IA family hydrolase [Caulobacter sp. S45]|uniref:HAD-IA family hydrolase n=1 Tax=Caulobacter sp. S45 TaxID=1641861 RepID=UPI00131CB221|nr:HAD-IA family hydrolase [Caulobacter sp. S45]